MSVSHSVIFPAVIHTRAIIILAAEEGQFLVEACGVGVKENPSPYGEQSVALEYLSGHTALGTPKRKTLCLTPLLPL